MKTYQYLLLLFAFLCIGFTFYLAATGHLNHANPALRLRSLMEIPCRKDDQCKSSEICYKGKCMDVCRGKCGLNEICSSLLHYNFCYCLPQFTRNSTTNICDIKSCTDDRHCQSNEECDIKTSKCQCKPNFIWDSLLKSCVEKNLELDNMKKLKYKVK